MVIDDGYSCPSKYLVQLINGLKVFVMRMLSEKLKDNSKLKG